MKTVLTFWVLFFWVAVVKGQDMRDTVWAGRLIKEATILINNDKDEEALAKLDTSGKIYLATIGEISEGYSDVLEYIGRICKYTYKLDTSISLFKRYIQIKQKVFGVENLSIAKSYEELGGLMHNYLNLTALFYVTMYL